MVTYMRNGYMKAAEMGPFYILVREEKAVGGLRSVPAPAPSVTTTPVGTATSAPAVVAGPEQVLSPVCLPGRPPWEGGPEKIEWELDN